MDEFVSKLRSNRFGLVVLLTALLVSVSIFSRIALVIYSSNSIDFLPRNIISALGLGLFFDITAQAFAAATFLHKEIR